LRGRHPDESSWTNVVIFSRVAEYGVVSKLLETALENHIMGD
jgi:hypothetical protein